jgi:hypothetical protein
MQIFCRSVGDRVEQEIETAPFLPDVREYGLKLTGIAHIAGNSDGTSELLGERANERFGLGVQVGNGEYRTGTAKHFGAAKGYAVPVSDADDQTLLAFKRHTFLRSALLTGCQYLHRRPASDDEST